MISDQTKLFGRFSCYSIIMQTSSIVNRIVNMDVSYIFFFKFVCLMHGLDPIQPKPVGEEKGGGGVGGALPRS